MLGMPFMKTSRTKIDCFTCLLTMEFDGDVIGHRIRDYNSIFIPNACYIESIKNPIGENHESNVVRTTSDPVVKPQIISVLGISPTLLTP